MLYLMRLIPELHGLIFFSRAYSSQTSAGSLVSGKGAKGDPLSRPQLLNEFQTHANTWNREPTAIVSVSDRIVDTVKRAFDKHYKDGESPGDIWIAFIKVPVTIHESPARVHAARDLAKECKPLEPELFQHEFVFEWAIPEEYVLHEVCLQTLMDRGLDWTEYLIQDGAGPRLPPTAELRRCIGRNLQPTAPCYDPWEIAPKLVCFARYFGARAPVDWIAHQLFHDCVRTRTTVEYNLVKVTYGHGDSETFEMDFFCDLDDEIETAFEWWLGDIDFLLDCQEFDAFKDAMEDRMVEHEIDFWETYDSYGQATINDAQDRLSARYDGIRACVEAEAVRIGL